MLRCLLRCRRRYEAMQRVKMQSVREERELKQRERLAALEDRAAKNAAEVKAVEDKAVTATGVAVRGGKSHLPPQLEDCISPVVIDVSCLARFPVPPPSAPPSAAAILMHDLPWRLLLPLSLEVGVVAGTQKL